MLTFVITFLVMLLILYIIKRLIFGALRGVLGVRNFIVDDEARRRRQIAMTEKLLEQPNLSATARTMLEKKLVELRGKPQGAPARTADDPDLWNEDPFNV